MLKISVAPPPPFPPPPPQKKKREKKEKKTHTQIAHLLAEGLVDTEEDDAITEEVASHESDRVGQVAHLLAEVQ